MHRKLNVRLLLWTLTSLAIVCIGAHFLHAYQVRRNAGSLLHQARRAAEQRQLAQAATYFKQYLAFESGDAEALAGYALALDGLPDRDEAFTALEEAVRRSPERHDLRRRAALAAKDLEMWPEAIRHLQALTKALPADGKLEFQLGWCYEAQGDAAAAAAAMTRALQKSPAHLDSYVGLAELLLRQNELEKAAEVMDDMVKANPRSPRALLHRARYHRERGDPAAAAADLKSAAQLAPEDADVLLAVAESEEQLGHATEARAALECGLKHHPRDARIWGALTALERRQGRRAEAIGCLRRALEALPESAGVLPLLADLLLDDGQAAEAERLTARLRKAQPASPLADYLTARILLGRGQAAEAGELLQQVRTRPGLPPAWAAQVEVALASCHEEAGDLEQWLAACRRAVALEPASLRARFNLGAVLLELGAVDEALVELRPLADAPGAPPEAKRLLARALMLRTVRQREAARQWPTVAAAVERAEQAEPGSPRVAVLRAEVLAVQGQFDAAAELLEKARDREPGEVLFWTALADLARLRGKTATAAAILAEARTKLGDPLELRLARLRHAVALKGADALNALLALAREPVDGLTRAGRQRLLSPLAQALLSAGSRAEAERLWTVLARENPRDLRSRMVLLDLALQSDSDEQARAGIAEVRRLEGEDGVLWRAGEASRLIRRARQGERSGLAAARKLLAEARRRLPEWGRVPLLEAAADEVEGKYAQAVEHYLLGVEKGDRDPAALARVARLLYERRRLLEAARVFRLLEEQAPLSGDMARLAADVALVQREPAHAAALARRAVAADSRDYRDHLWLAHVLAEAGERVEAEKSLRAAIRVGARIPDTWVALVRHLARAGRTKEAEAALEEARRALPATRVTLALARCQEALGRLDQAEALYREALAARPADFIALRALAHLLRRADDFPRAEPLLRKLIDPATRAPEEFVASARRQLAVGLAESGRAGAFAEATALLDRNAQAPGGEPEDEYARAFVLATNPAHRAEALRLLERQEASKRALPPEGQFLRVRAYEALGERARARDLFLGLLAAHGDDPQFLAHHIRMLLGEGDLEQAARALERLERLEPDSRRTRALREELARAK